MSSDMDIPYFEYFKDSSELLASNDKKEAELKTLSESMEAFSNTDIDLVSDQKLGFIDDLVDRIEQNSWSYKELSELFLDKQNNAFLFAIHNKVLWHKSIMHCNDLARELKQIEDRPFSDRMKDFFKGDGKVKRKRATQISNALKLIRKKLEELEQVQDCNGHILPEDVCAELLQMREKIGEERFSKMYEFISDNYSLDLEKVQTKQQEIDEREKLPVAQNKKKRMSEAEKMKYFLNENGYIQDEEQNNDTKRSIYIDVVQQEAGRCIQANRKCIDCIALCDKVLRGEEHEESKEMKAIDEEFNIVK